MIDIQKIKTHKAIGIILISLNLLSPGLLGVAFFEMNLFIALDTIKLILLSVSLSTPFTVFTFFICTYFYDQVLEVSPLNDSDLTEDHLIEKLEDTEANDYNILLFTGIGSSIAWGITAVIGYLVNVLFNGLISSRLIPLLCISYIFSIVVIAFFLVRIANRKSESMASR